MRKVLSYRGLKFTGLPLVFLVFGVRPGDLVAQDGAKAAATAAAPMPVVAMPSDPKELLELAARQNGLTGAELRPWHLKASFQVFDDEGKVKDQVTMEEFWAGPKKNRVSYSGKELAQTIYSTESGLMRSGSTGLLPFLVEEAGGELLRPLPDVDFFEHYDFRKKERKTGGVQLLCLEEKQQAPAGTFLSSSPLMYCLSDDKPVLRVTLAGGGVLETVRNKIALFQGRYVPLEMMLSRSAKPSVTVHVDSLESLRAPEESDFAPPADAVPLEREVAISSGLANGLILSKAVPHYPMEAKAAHISGTIVMSARIDKEGHVGNLEVVSGPRELQKAALDAVRQWVYRPYLLNGEPVVVKTTINIVFNLEG
jgi:TonB family protein